MWNEEVQKSTWVFLRGPLHHNVKRLNGQLTGRLPLFFPVITRRNQNDFPAQQVSSFVGGSSLPTANLLGPKLGSKHAVRRNERRREAAVTAASDRSNRAVSSRLIKLPGGSLDGAKVVTPSRSPAYRP